MNSLQKRGRLLLRGFPAEEGGDEQEVFPDQALHLRVAQQVGGMEGRNEYRGTDPEDFSANTGDRCRGPEQGLRGESAQGEQDPGSEQGELPAQVRRTGRDLWRGGISIVRGSA